MELQVKVKETEYGEVVSARELHEKLQVGRDFTNWIKARIDKYGFRENEDYQILLIARQNGRVEKRGGHNKKDYTLTLDMAKELAMIENNDIGREIRKQFIEREKRFRVLQEKSIKMYKTELIECSSFQNKDVMLGTLDSIKMLENKMREDVAEIKNILGSMEDRLRHIKLYETQLRKFITGEVVMD